MSWWRANLCNAIRSPAAGAVVLALPLLVVALSTGLGFSAQTDEIKYHWDTIRQFGQAWPAIPWRDYRAATSPLPYVLWGIWGRLFGFELPALRALTVIMTYAGVLAFYALARRRGHARPLAESLVLLFSPYVFLNSFTVYTVNMGLLFLVLALRFYLDEERLGWKGLWWGGWAAAAAIYCRQHYLFLPAGLGLAWLIRRGLQRRVSWADGRDLALILLPVALFLPLYGSWGGFTPPAFQELHPFRLSPEHINFLLVFIGFYFAPLAVMAWPKVVRWGRRGLWALLGVPFYWAFRPYYVEELGTLSSSEQGIILHGLDLIQTRLLGGNKFLADLAQFGLWANGLVIMAAAVSMALCPLRSETMKLWSWVMAFAGVVLASSFVGERFYALIMPILLVWLYPYVAGRQRIVACWVADMALLAVVYSAIKMGGG